MSEAEAVRAAAGLPENEHSLERADAALGEVLVLAAQRYLKRVSNEWDVELFFDTYGIPPRDGSSWSRAIIDGLNFRKDLPVADVQELVSKSIQEAVALLHRAEEHT